MGMPLLSLLALSLLPLLLPFVTSSPSTGVQSEYEYVDDEFYRCVTNPLETSLLVKLLGTGGVLVEDLSNNLMTELLIRLRSKDASEINGNLVKQRRILEPLLTRAALSEWHYVTKESPYPSHSHKKDSTHGIICRQLQRDCVDYGLALVLQLGELLNIKPDRLSTLRWVLQRTRSTSASGLEEISVAVPISTWNISTLSDLQQFLASYHPFEDINVGEISLPHSRL